MSDPILFNWKTPIADVLGVLRQAYAGRFPALASAQLDPVADALADAESERWLPALGQEMQALGLALIEQWENDDAINLYVAELANVDEVVERIEAEGWEAIVHRRREKRPSQMPTPNGFALETPVADVLAGLRQAYAGTFPALASERLDGVARALADDEAGEDWPSALGQEMEALGLALIERIDNDDDDDEIRHLHVVEHSAVDAFVEQAEAEDADAFVHRQEERAFGAPAYLPDAPGAPLFAPSAYRDLRILWPLDGGWAIADSRSEPGRVLLDLRQWPDVREVRSELAAQIERCWTAGPDGLRAWIRSHWTNPANTQLPYEALYHEELCFTQLPLESGGPVNALPLRPPQAMSQRSLPDYALGFVGDDVLLADDHSVVLLRQPARTPAGLAPVREPLLALPPRPELSHVAPAIVHTADGRTCVFCQQQFFQWRDGALHRLHFLDGEDAPENICAPVPSRASRIAWTQDGLLCEGDLATGEVLRHALDGLPYHDALAIDSLPGDWLLLRHGAGQHRATDIAQLWHLGSDRVVRIRHGHLALEGSLEHWIELPDGGIVAGDDERMVGLGRFDALLRRLESGAASA
ncbi:hypothetical protein LDO31_15075 [Luteimonas sp. XNQY3]|nr:hypothetical protein [Luteimonas sp. XNQY3]MCD9007536.1 hypothetical protein [Luteimonas sp. XNQY3]